MASPPLDWGQLCVRCGQLHLGDPIERSSVVLAGIETDDELESTFFDELVLRRVAELVRDGVDVDDVINEAICYDMWGDADEIEDCSVRLWRPSAPTRPAPPRSLIRRDAVRGHAGPTGTGLSFEALPAHGGCARRT